MSSETKPAKLPSQEPRLARLRLWKKTLVEALRQHSETGTYFIDDRHKATYHTARGWNSLRTRINLDHEQQSLEEIFSALSNGDAVLEIGFGKGNFLLEAKKKFDWLKYVGFSPYDFSEGQLQNNGIEVVLGGVENIRRALRGRSFGLITANTVMMYVREYPTFLLTRDLYNLLQPGGKYVGDHIGGSQFMINAEGYEKWLAAQGMKRLFQFVMDVEEVDGKRLDTISCTRIQKDNDFRVLIHPKFSLHALPHPGDSGKLSLVPEYLGE